MSDIYTDSDFPTVLANAQDIIANFTGYDGPVSVSLGEFDLYMKTVVVSAIIFGTRIGLSALAFPVTYMITKNRKSPIFILNMSCLAVLFLQSCLYAVTLTKGYNTISYTFSGNPDLHKSASNISVVSNLFSVLLIILVELSFSYQVYIIFESPQKNMRRLGYGATTISVALGITTVVFYFIFMVYSNLSFYNNNVNVPGYLANTPLILFVTSSCVICVMLLCKLAFAIRKRRYLGLKQFNLFHILFIMAFQTMVIPTILILISFNGFSETDQYSSQAFSALGTALISLSLPLTTMWANSSISDSTPTSTSNLYSPAYTSSSEDNKTLATSLTNYYPKASFDDYNVGSPEKETLDDFTIQPTPATQDDQRFWKEVEMYTKDLDRNSDIGAISEESIHANSHESSSKV
ncbi:hypothetical protein CANINC_001275 [Pichia inconspicua]|uniref:Pheromone alpha factor receptor n=1 Tax=Pichia inconspicua TaxID=52247 RepID=A0A4T0X4E8_9ASCO|nr:hypothetical protein CANINC_001275 [[Candida] inconspicua]